MYFLTLSNTSAKLADNLNRVQWPPECLSHLIYDWLVMSHFSFYTWCLDFVSVYIDVKNTGNVPSMLLDDLILQILAFLLELALANKFFC